MEEWLRGVLFVKNQAPEIDMKAFCLAESTVKEVIIFATTLLTINQAGLRNQY